jgi:hypothetical protein
MKVLSQEKGSMSFATKVGKAKPDSLVLKIPDNMKEGREGTPKMKVE